MRIVFLGTPEFAVPSLNALTENYEVVGVVTQPDREKDRKGRVIKGAVASVAESKGIPVFKFEKIRTEGADALRSLRPDIMVTCAYGQILSEEILNIPRLGVLNVHGSLLPLYRGSAPIQRAIMNGERETGITIMKTDVGMDSGDILSQQKVTIENDDYVGDLYEKLSVIGANLLIKTIEGYVSGSIKPVPQDAGRATYAPMLKKEEAYLDFSASCESVRNVIRGMGYGVCLLSGAPLKIYRADLREDNGKPGEILVAAKNDFVVACGAGALEITELQASGKKRMKTSDFLNGTKIAAGEFLTSAKG